MRQNGIQYMSVVIQQIFICQISTLRYVVFAGESWMLNKIFWYFEEDVGYVIYDIVYSYELQ